MTNTYTREAKNRLVSRTEQIAFDLALVSLKRDLLLIADMSHRAQNYSDERVINSIIEFIDNQRKFN